jgi:hypothetical protein
MQAQLAQNIAQALMRGAGHGRKDSLPFQTLRDIG